MDMNHTHKQPETEQHAGHKMTSKPGKPAMSHRGHMAADFQKRFWVSLLLTLPILALSPAIQGFLGLGATIRFAGDQYLLFALATIVYIYGGAPFLKGFVTEMKMRRPGMMTLVAVAITTAYIYSSLVVFGLTGTIFFWELATLVDVMLLGHWLEMKSVMGASRALEELAKLMPSTAHLLTSEGVTDVPLERLKVGDKVLVKPGEKIPVDGDVVGGETSVNEAMLTGESLPASKAMGDKVIGGAINGEGSITVEIKKTGRDSFLSQVIELVKEARESKSKTQSLADKAAMYLTIVAITGGLLTLLVWLAVIHQSFAFALERMVTVMVITCPHALGLAIPLVVAVSTALSAQNGLLIRNRTAFERAKNIQAIIFDKTGTLTEGRFGVTDTLLFNESISADELLRFAASVEVDSEHPIAKGVVAAAEKTVPVERFMSIPGKGARGRVNEREVEVVSPGYLRENNLAVADDRIEKLASQGKTIVFVVIDGKVRGALALADIIRPESKKTISMLKAAGIKCMMLTGDNGQTAKWVADQLLLDDYFAEVLPDKKSAKVKEVQSRGLIVAMVGDGVNDAPALAQADVGIAIGAGTDVAVETADIVLVKNNPMDAVAIISLSKATYRKMAQNLLWATGYNVLAIPIAAGALFSYGVLLTPAAGAALMSLSTVIVAINARFLKIESV